MPNCYNKPKWPAFDRNWIVNKISLFRLGYFKPCNAMCLLILIIDLLINVLLTVWFVQIIIRHFMVYLLCLEQWKHLERVMHKLKMILKYFFVYKQCRYDQFLKIKFNVSYIDIIAKDLSLIMCKRIKCHFIWNAINQSNY